MIDFEIIGKECRKVRVDLGLSQADVAIETGFTPQHICGFEHGRSASAELLAWYVANGYDLKSYAWGAYYGNK